MMQMMASVMKAARDKHANQASRCEQLSGRVIAATAKTDARILPRQLELARALGDYLH